MSQTIVLQTVDNVVTRDYIEGMNEKRSTKWPAARKSAGALLLKETSAMPGVGLVIPLRVAKAKLSALLEMVSQGRQVTITSDGVPKAVISPVSTSQGRQRFQGMGEFLLAQPVHGGPPAEELVREDRDARGW
jgi:prevent-host-death family protein